VRLEDDVLMTETGKQSASAACQGFYCVTAIGDETPTFATLSRPLVYSAWDSDCCWFSFGTALAMVNCIGAIIIAGLILALINIVPKPPIVIFSLPATTAGTYSW